MQASVHSIGYRPAGDSNEGDAASVSIVSCEATAGTALVNAMSNEPLSLEKMFNPRSIAVVGASNRPSTYGSMVLDMLVAHRCPTPHVSGKPPAFRNQGNALLSGTSRRSQSR